MLLESVSSTAKRVEDLLNNVNSNNISSDAPIRIEDHFTGMVFFSAPFLILELYLKSAILHHLFLCYNLVSPLIQLLI